MKLLHELNVSTGIAIYDLLRIINTAPARYKTYFIPKRDGGQRMIAHPSREVKILQRFLLKKYLRRLPVHQAAFAYVKDRNILHNARVHVDQEVILKLDFTDFFTSINVNDWRIFLSKHKSDVFDIKDFEITKQLLFWSIGSRVAKCLSIGAPTSPTVSNIIMFEFDQQVAEIANTFGVGFSRYADDITISGCSSEQVLKVERALARVLQETKSSRLKFNDRKRGLFSRGSRQMVTGLILTPDGKISLGRERKRMISALLHRFSNGDLDTSGVDKLKGFVGFSLANEPAFVERMRVKYGNELIDRVLREPNSSQR